MSALIRRLPLGRVIPTSLAPSRNADADAAATKKSTAAPPAPAAPAAASEWRERGAASFVTLPVEIHLLISRYLIYPDALSLKHTNRYFYALVDTGIKLKIDWLVERRQLHLECPNNQRCDLGSDLRFCRGSVRCVPFASSWLSLPTSAGVLY